MLICKNAAPVFNLTLSRAKFFILYIDITECVNFPLKLYKVIF